MLEDAPDSDEAPMSITPTAGGYLVTHRQFSVTLKAGALEETARRFAQVAMQAGGLHPDSADAR